MWYPGSGVVLIVLIPDLCFLTFFLMPMQSHSHRVAFGYVKFHLPICFPLSQAVEVLQNQIVLKRIQDSVVCEQVNRRPGAHRIVLGLDLRLGHLKLLVKCTQRVMS